MLFPEEFPFPVWLMWSERHARVPVLLPHPSRIVRGWARAVKNLHQSWSRLEVIVCLSKSSVEGATLYMPV